MGEMKAMGGELVLNDRVKVQRLPGESPEAYAAFRVYCELSADRRTLESHTTA